MAAQRRHDQRGHGGQRNQNFDFSPWKEKIDRWIKQKIDSETIEFANAFGKSIADNRLTTSQIRNAFGELRRIQMNGYVNQKTDFLLLKPKLAYAVKRHNNRGLNEFYNFFEIGYSALDKENDENGDKQFKNLMELMEAVLAYHKYHGGRE